MFIVVASQQAAASAYVSEFIGVGVHSLGVDANQFDAWLDTSPIDFKKVRGFLVDGSEKPRDVIKVIRQHTQAPVIAFSASRSLEATLELLTAGIDDVVSRPVHVREILARSEAVWRRHNESQVQDKDPTARIKVFFTGQDPEVDGTPMVLPRRERGILEFLVRHQGRPVTRSQVFRGVYDDCEGHLEETVVEGHTSKLRKKLRARLGYDPIVSKRYEGYTYHG